MYFCFSILTFLIWPFKTPVLARSQSTFWFKCPFLQLFILVLYFKLNSSDKSMLWRMTVPTCAQSFETFRLFWYTSVYDSFKIFNFKLCCNCWKYSLQKIFTVCEVEYTQYLILNLGLTVHIVFCFWLHVNKICYQLVKC